MTNMGIHLDYQDIIHMKRTSIMTCIIAEWEITQTDRYIGVL